MPNQNLLQFVSMLDPNHFTLPPQANKITFPTLLPSYSSTPGRQARMLTATLHHFLSRPRMAIIALDIKMAPCQLCDESGRVCTILVSKLFNLFLLSSCKIPNKPYRYFF